MSFGDGNLHERVAELERALAERDALIRDLWRCVEHNHDCGDCLVNGEECWSFTMRERMERMGIGVK